MSKSFQPSFDELGVSLAEETFVVVDLETTGTRVHNEITEIGAVKIRGGEVLGEFQSLVRPHMPIPPLIQALTGITPELVATAPRIEEVLPLFDHFSAGAVLVAHNARFDIGVLRQAYQELEMEWRSPRVIDTLALARKTLARSEVPNHKLSTLARFFRAQTAPNHRALSDARATVDVFHSLLERVGNSSTHSVSDLTDLTSSVAPWRRSKKAWADKLPQSPGVYFFYRDALDNTSTTQREILYVGTSKDLRARVRSYFSASEKRRAMNDMLRLASGVDHFVCETTLEAQVRELRLIQSLAPRYNRRSKNQSRLRWLTFTNEPFPRLSLSTTIKKEEPYFGPFSSREAADDTRLLLQETFQLRSCTTRLSRSHPSPACALAQLQRCLAPCQLELDEDAYREMVTRVAHSWDGDIRPVLRGSQARLSRLITQQRFEEAAQLAARLKRYYAKSIQFHQVRSIAVCPQIVAAAPIGQLWDVHIIRFGKLAAAARVPTRQVLDTAEQLVLQAETVLQPAARQPAGTFEEAEKIAQWLELPGLRLLSTEGDWAWPIHVGISAQRFRDELVGKDSGVRS